MNKLVSCSFDDQGVIITAWNGVHPDKPGHFSITKLVSRPDFNKAVKNRLFFSDILGIDIRLGWQNAIRAATENAKNLNFDINKAAEFVANGMAAMHGEEKTAAIMAAGEEENAKMLTQLKGIIDDGSDKKAGTGKSGKKRGRAPVDKPSV